MDTEVSKIIPCYPTKHQKYLFNQLFQQRRLVWNSALALAKKTKQARIDWQCKGNNVVLATLSELKRRFDSWLANEGPEPRLLKEGYEDAVSITNFKVLREFIVLPDVGHVRLDCADAILPEDRVELIRSGREGFSLRIARRQHTPDKASPASISLSVAA